jgi:hypothetical protein
MISMMTSTIEWYRHPEDPAPSTMDLLVYTKSCKIFKAYWCEKSEKFFYEDTSNIDEVSDVILWAYATIVIYPKQIISPNEACDILLRYAREIKK